MLNPIGSGTAAIGTAESPRPKDLGAAARDFEALLLAQLLRSARESGDSGGWLGSGEDAAATTATEMAEQQFAQSLAAQGGLGLAAMVTANMADRTDQSRSIQP